MKKPYCWSKILIWENRSGKNVKRIWEPSKGGMGTKLNIAKRIFIKTMYEKIVTRPETSEIPGKNLRTNPKIKAKDKFEAGPAKADLAPPYF